MTEGGLWSVRPRPGGQERTIVGGRGFTARSKGTRGAGGGTEGA